MAHQTPVREDSSRFAAEHLAEFAQRVQRVRVSVRYLLVDFWDESRRLRALELVRLLKDGQTEGAKGVSRIVQSLTALLSLPYGDACAIRRPLEEKLLELLELLQDQCRPESA